MNRLALAAPSPHAGGAGGVPAPRQALTIAVTTGADEFGSAGSACSLREAVQTANTDAAFGGCTAGEAAVRRRDAPARRAPTRSPVPARPRRERDGGPRRRHRRRRPLAVVGPGRWARRRSIANVLDRRDRRDRGLRRRAGGGPRSSTARRLRRLRASKAAAGCAGSGPLATADARRHRFELRRQHRPRRSAAPSMPRHDRGPHDRGLDVHRQLRVRPRHDPLVRRALAHRLDDRRQRRWRAWSRRRRTRC